MGGQVTVRCVGHVRGLMALAIAVIALAITATTASASTTRADWVAQVDPICQNGQAQEATAFQPLLRATKRESRHRDSRKQRKRVQRAFRLYNQQQAAIEHAVNAQIATIPPAPDDVSLVQVWLRARGELVDLETQLLNGGANPKKGSQGVNQLLRSFLELIGRQQEVGDLVRDFGFQYCNTGQPEVAIIGNLP
jgi:hypothetical protein